MASYVLYGIKLKIYFFSSRYIFFMFIATYQIIASDRWDLN